MARKNANARKLISNFWNDLRVNNGIKMRDIAILLDANEKHVACYFNGQLKPSDEHIAKLCDFFGVDLVEGKAAFYKMHEDYETRRKAKLAAKFESNETIASTSTTYTIVDDPIVDTSTEEENDCPVSEVTKDVVLRMLYKVVDYDVFIKLQQDITNISDILPAIYQKVSFDEFMKISSVVEG